MSTEGGAATTREEQPFDHLVHLVNDGRLEEVLAILQSDKAAINAVRDWHHDSLLVSES
jgi:hypothetical protein